MLLHFSQIVQRVCTLVLLIISIVWMVKASEDNMQTLSLLQRRKNYPSVKVFYQISSKEVLATT